MSRDHLPLSVNLVSPDAEATLKLRADLAEISSLAVTFGQANETILHGPGEE
jgi:hypothetical protein